MAPTSLPDTTDRRLASLLTLFAPNATIAISGARIAKEIGVSRSTVWRWVERLREVGVRVKGKPNTGYFLESVPDILTPDLIRQQIKGSLFEKKIHHYFRTDSTNRVAMELGSAGEPEGTVVLAEEQTAGKGRAWAKLAFRARCRYLRYAAAAAENFSGAGATFDNDRRTFCARGNPGTNRASAGFEVAERLTAGRKENRRNPHRNARGNVDGGVRNRGHRINVNQDKFQGGTGWHRNITACGHRKKAVPIDLLARLLREFETDYNCFLRRREIGH
jgi:biotin operon repressor